MIVCAPLETPVFLDAGRCGKLKCLFNLEGTSPYFDSNCKQKSFRFDAKSCVPQARNCTSLTSTDNNLGTNRASNKLEKIRKRGSRRIREPLNKNPSSYRTDFYEILSRLKVHMSMF